MDSYRFVSASWVLEKAQTVLGRIAAHRKTLFDKAVQMEMDRRLFPAKTREQAEKRVRQDRSAFCPDWKISAWGDERDAKRLIALCETNSVTEMILLSAEDALIIQKYTD